MLRVFMIQGTGTNKDSSENEIDFKPLHNNLITPALQR